MTFGGSHAAERLVPALPKEVKQGRNPPQWVADRKVATKRKARGMCKRNMSLSSFQQEMTALFPQGRVAFGNFGDFPACPIAHL
jgi:hypothetical protein